MEACRYRVSKIKSLILDTTSSVVVTSCRFFSLVFFSFLLTPMKKCGSNNSWD